MDGPSRTLNHPSLIIMLLKGSGNPLWGDWTLNLLNRQVEVGDDIIIAKCDSELQNYELCGIIVEQENDLRLALLKLV